ncbi:hypothetical protein BGX28_001563 [Mortierella sp. GBA30]|nr:hypothetical protein BGX28_001563 [Mortierella sp. GBA30]
MRFQRHIFHGSTTFTWRNIEQDDGIFYRFVCDDETTNYNANNFEITVYRGMYEHKYRKPYTTANEEDFQEFEISTAVQGSESTSSLERQLYQYDCLVEFSGSLHLYDTTLKQFMVRGSRLFCQLLRDNASMENSAYWLSIVDVKDMQQLSQPLDVKMTPLFNPNNCGFIWNTPGDRGVGQCTWLFQFQDSDCLKRFRVIYSKCMYDIVQQESAPKGEMRDIVVLEEDQQFARRMHIVDVEMEQPGEHLSPEEDTDREESNDEAEAVQKYGVKRTYYDDDDEEYEDELPRFGDDGKSRNSQLAVGYKDRSFVVRGSKIGVFNHNGRDGLDFSTTITNLSNSRHREVKPSKVILHEQDTAMIMMDNSDKNTAYKMDLEYGKIVEEWDLAGTSGVVNFAASSKYGFKSNDKTMVGLAKDAVFRIDPRLAGNKIARTEFKQYARSNNFVCSATSGNGSLAVASAKGTIQLYNELGSKAKTVLQSMGGPIIGIDVTGHGRYILATCKDSIMVIDVLNPASKKLGFDARFHADSKPDPIVLKLKPQHIAAMKCPVSFTTARFNMGENEEEKAIVTSTGPYVVTWNFRRVKLGYKDYQIKEYADTVVADNFKYGQDRSIFVTLPHNVTTLQKKNLVNLSEAFGNPDRKR